MSNVNQTTMSDAVKTQYNRNLLIRALPRLIHGRWGQKSIINQFGSEEWRRYGSLAAVTTPLSEGTTPSEQSAPTLTLVTATPLFYGAWLGLTDEIDMTTIDPAVMWMSEVLAEQCGLSIDTLRRNDITAGATKVYAGGAANRGAVARVTSDISFKEFLKAVATLWASNAREVQGNRYVVILHPDSLATLFLDPSFYNLFTEEAGRMDGSALRSGFVGSILNCDIYCTSNAREYTDEGLSNADVYSALFIGKEAYGMSGMGAIAPKEVDNAGPEVKNMTGRGGVSASPVQLIVKQLGSAGADDPLNQRGTVAWKAGEDTVILNSAFIVDMEHTNIRS